MEYKYFFLIVSLIIILFISCPNLPINNDNEELNENKDTKYDYYWEVIDRAFNAKKSVIDTFLT